ncbi:hypothetical protein ACO2Q0_20440 [Phenylobacterium sp. VNQ135]|uniref:hypothetical protein n=1 Tax=Phenylobacterium sp. VNQ135 TaxID=3400922 RepID=UPI003C0A6DCE
MRLRSVKLRFSPSSVVNWLRRTLLARRVFLYAPGISADDQWELERRARFYFGPRSKMLLLRDGSFLPWLLFYGPVLTFVSPGHKVPAWLRPSLGVYDVNFRTNSNEAWSWAEAEAFFNGYPDRSRSKQNFIAWRGQILKEQLKKVYLFGTGPSLAQAINCSWQDGYRIVCNTIVRDAELWHHISPHAVVAADALYHFGPTKFAETFRADLLRRLQESPDVVFIYPDIFHCVVAREIPIEAHRLIPIHKQPSNQLVHKCVTELFALPGLGNVLNLMLLPVGCSLSKHVKLWGFDGRAPQDALFWANSSKHSYPELMETLQEAHPAFFDHFVPARDPEAYVRAVHGDVLEHCLAQAEADGWTFEMLHRSWTPTLERRRRVAADLAVPS